MNDIENFLQNLFQLPYSVVSEEDNKKIKFEGIPKYIRDKLNSSKYKSTSFPSELLEKIRSITEDSVKKNLPIHLTVPFGGFKKWQLPSYPYPEWSEVFNIIFLRNYLLPIAAAYEPGIILHYVSDEVVISKMNNYPQSDLDIYNNNFQNILDYLNKFNPENVKFIFTKIRDEISQEEILKRFEEDMPLIRNEWEAIPDREKEIKLEKSFRNYQTNFAHMSKQEIDKSILRSCLMHEAFVGGTWDKDIPWAFGPDMIPIGFTYTGKWGLHIKSSTASTVQFWVGIGVLEQRNNKIIPTIFTYNQFIKNKEKLISKKLNLFTEELNYLNKIYLLEK